MHVLYFHQYFTTPDGAGGTRSYEFARRLVERGHRVTMVCGSDSRAHTGLSGPFVRGRREGMVDGIHVVQLDLPYSNSDGFLKRSLTFLRFALRSIGVALTSPCDIVFATSTPLTAGIPGICARWLRGRRFVFEVRDLWPELPRAMEVIRNPIILAGMGMLEWLSYHSAHLCVALSPGIVEGICRRGIPPARVTMIPNGCDLDLLDGAISGKRPDGVGESDLVAAFTGAHGLANGLDAVLDAAAVLVHRGRTDIKLLFVGEGKLKPALVARAQREGLWNCVFLDSMPKRELMSLLRAVDVGLMILANVPAFYYGTSPNKFFDYLAVGLPVLTNYPGWLADMITQYECGVAVPPSDAEAFADALVHLADHRALLAEMGRRAAQMAQDEFHRAHLADRFAGLLENVGRVMA
jgi:glycosyltransferase involved in cell wall biosynthesis